MISAYAATTLIRMHQQTNGYAQSTEHTQELLEAGLVKGIPGLKVVATTEAGRQRLIDVYL